MLIAPDRELAAEFTATLPEAKGFQILSELKQYPTEATLEIRLRQLQPDVLLIDLASNLDTAEKLIQQVAGLRTGVQVIGLHRTNDGIALVRSLRAGAIDFLHAPFDPAAQQDAASRIRRLREPDPETHQELGKVIAFSSAKPGSGASTLAIQMAFNLRRLTGKRVLLMDFDLLCGSVAFALKIASPYSLLDAVEQCERMDPALWSTLTTNVSGIDVLAAPEVPGSETLEPNRLHDVIEYVRTLYDWVVIDLPNIFHRVSLFALSEADQSLIVSTGELPSLHLTRRAVGLLGQLGFGQDRYQVVINRANKREGISQADMEKIFNCTVYAIFPNDYYALHRVVTKAEPLSTDGELGRALAGVASRIAGQIKSDFRKGETLMEQKPALSQT